MYSVLLGSARDLFSLAETQELFKKGRVVPEASRHQGLASVAVPFKS